MKHEYLDKQRLKAALHILRNPQSMEYLQRCRIEGKTSAFIRLQIATSLFDDEQADKFAKHCEEHKNDFIDIPRSCKGEKICRGCRVGKRVCCAYYKVAGLTDYIRVYQLSPHKRGKAKQFYPLLTERESECCCCYVGIGMDQDDIAGYLTCLGYFGTVTKNSVTKSIQRARKKGYDVTKRTKPKSMIRFNDAYMADERAERSPGIWGIVRKF